MIGVPFAAAATLLVLGASPASAEPREQPIAVRVMVAHARVEQGRVDPECESLQKQLAPLNFGSLHAVQLRTFRLHMGQRGAIALPTGAELRIVPLSIIRKRLNLRVEVPGTVNTRLQMSSGKPVIVGGPRHEGGHLIVQIIPEY
jgi:hypothetical protein